MKGNVCQGDLDKLGQAIITHRSEARADASVWVQVPSGVCVPQYAGDTGRHPAAARRSSQPTRTRPVDSAVPQTITRPQPIIQAVMRSSRKSAP